MSWPGLAWKKFGDKDILTKMSWDILSTCPEHVLCPLLCPQIFSGQARPFPTKDIKTNKSAEERKCSANNAYNKYFYKLNIMIDQIALNLYNNQVEKQNK